MATVKEQLKDALVKLGYEAKKVQLDYPAQEEHGDYATNLALVLAKERGVKPMELAEEIAKQLVKDSALQQIVEKVEAVKPGFVNFYLSRGHLNKELVQINEVGADYGKSDIGSGKKIIIEYSSPNTNKPLHLGHLRTNFLGMALGNILSSQGHDLVLTEIVNDRGVGVSQAMLAYELYGDNDTPEKSKLKSDHFVGKYYVKFNKEVAKKPELKDQVQELLCKWEAGDKETRELWFKIRKWAEDGYHLTYEKIGSHFDMHEYESDIYDKGKEIVLNALKQGKVQEVEGGAVAINLSQYKLGGREDGHKILIKSDGTAMYITQDLYLAVKRWQEHKPDKVLYVVGDEQIYHFKVLFKILELFGYEWVRDRYFHLFYGQVNLPEGKMKSREGTVVDADNLIEDLEEMAKEEIKKRTPAISDSELLERATSVALAAIKFFILKVDARSAMTYDPKASLDFEGNTGPYIQYAYARINSILNKVGESKVAKAGYEMTAGERAILVRLTKYSEVLDRSAKELKPHFLAEYLYDLAAKINSWYVKHPVLKAEPEVRAWRLQLITAVKNVLGSGLQLLGIKPLERM